MTLKQSEEQLQTPSQDEARPTSPGNVNLSTSDLLKDRLRQLMEESKRNDLKAEAILQKANQTRKGLKDTLESCHKTLEATGGCLADHFRHIPSKALDAEIALRFRDFDQDRSGSLDKEELREALAEMGQRPTDEELEHFFSTCDTDGDGSIDLPEFNAMVRVKLRLLSPARMEAAAIAARKTLRRLGLRSSAPAARPLPRLGPRQSVNAPGSLPALAPRPLSAEGGSGPCAEAERGSGTLVSVFDEFARTRSVAVESCFARKASAPHLNSNTGSKWARRKSMGEATSIALPDVGQGGCADGSCRRRGSSTEVKTTTPTTSSHVTRRKHRT